MVPWTQSLANRHQPGCLSVCLYPPPPHHLPPSIQDRKEFLRTLGRIVEMVTILHAVHDCRDVRDNHILEVAVNGQAKVIVTGDEDLLVLNPFRGIPIMRPASFLKWEIATSQPPNNRLMHISSGYPYHSILLKFF